MCNIIGAIGSIETALESLAGDGIAFTVNGDDANAVHIVRHPVNAIRTLLRQRLFSDGDECPAELVGDRDTILSAYPVLRRVRSEVERAALYYVARNTECEGESVVRVRSEDGPLALSIGLSEIGIERYGLPEFSEFNEPFPASFDLYRLPDKLRGAVINMAMRYGYIVGEPESAPRVFWFMPLERSVQDIAVNAAVNVAMDATANGYQRVTLPYTRIDSARNEAARAFVNMSKNPDDTLVMLDNDHVHPMDIITRLASQNVGVVGALSFMRGGTPKPLFFIRNGDGYHHVKQWEPDSLYECAIVGTGAIAIKRWVFDKLEETGYRWPWFRYEYPPGLTYSPTEDVYFGKICELAGIKHHVHTGIVTPHIGVTMIDEKTFQRFMEAQQ